MSICEPVIRPPSEAGSFLLQLTSGCSANTCDFCAAYKGKPFYVKPWKEITGDIHVGAATYPRTRKVFLMDGDALVLNNERLVPVLSLINQRFPRLTRISSYANGTNIIKRSRFELQELANNRLKLIYMGLESGCQELLNDNHKPSSVQDMIQAVHQAGTVGIKASVIVLLGLGGKEKSRAHVQDTITALNAMQPRLLSFLTLMIVPGTPFHSRQINGQVTALDSQELLIEARDILAGLTMNQTVFRCNHASNYLELEGRLPQDKPRLLDELDAALSGDRRLRPECFRGL